jgi:hypothetical protein
MPETDPVVYPFFELYPVPTVPLDEDAELSTRLHVVYPRFDLCE